MSRALTFNQQETEDIINLYQNELWSLDKIAKKYGVGRTGITTFLKKHNIHIRSLKEVQAAKKGLSEEDKDKIIYNYTVLHQGLQTAGQEFNCNQTYVENLLKERGIQKRTYVEAKDALRKYELDDNFFKNQSSEMAYFLGLIAADGNVALNENKIRIELQASDASILEQYKKITNNSRNIKFRTNNMGCECAYIDAYSSIWKKDLEKYGITPRKTLTLTPPDLLDPKYRMDYIRGYFDGDGSVYERQNRLLVQFDGASKQVIDWIRNEFNNHGVSTTQYSHYVTANGVDIYRLVYERQNLVAEIKKLLYPNDDIVCLQRKQEKFNSL